MADYTSQATFLPVIHEKHFTDWDKKVLSALNIEGYTDEYGFTSLYAEEGGTSGFIEQEDGNWKDLTEDDLIDVLQGIIQRSNGEIKWISKETAHTCSRMIARGFGGSAMFVTSDEVRFCSTVGWLEERVSEIETGNIGPHDDKMEATPIKSHLINFNPSGDKTFPHGGSFSRKKEMTNEEV